LYFIKGKGFGTTFNTYNEGLLAATKANYHHVILGKPGTPFCDSISTSGGLKDLDAGGLISGYKFSEEYTRRLGLDWRVQASHKVIGYLIRHGYWDKTKIVAYGYSEDAQVVSFSSCLVLGFTE
jgi:hypothetical protein